MKNIILQNDLHLLNSEANYNHSKKNQNGSDKRNPTELQNEKNRQLILETKR